MAAVEDEDGQNQKKKDDHYFNTNRKHFSAMQQDLESKLLRIGNTYEMQVGTILSGWDHLTGAFSVAQLPFAKFLYSWTLKLVLKGEWPKLEKIVKTRLGATLQRCTRDKFLEPMCKKLIPLVTDPWGHHTLKEIVAGSDVSIDDVKNYIQQESIEIIMVRIETMISSHCEELALSLLKALNRCVNLQTYQNPVDSPLPSKEDHNHFVDLFFVLLYKFHRKKFFEKVKELNVEDGVNLVRRLMAQQEKAKVWKHRLKIAEITIQIVLASCAVKPYNDLFRLVFSEWCNVMKSINAATYELITMTRKYIQLTESSRHTYSMASLLHHEFGDSYAALVTELLIGALTRDLNSLERVKSIGNSSEGRINEEQDIKHQMATGFMYLSSVFAKYEKVGRECVLTAFSLHPTIERFGIIKRFIHNNDSPSTLSPPADVMNSETNVNHCTSPVKHSSGLSMTSSPSRTNTTNKISFFDNSGQCIDGACELIKVKQENILDTDSEMKPVPNILGGDKAELKNIHNILGSEQAEMKPIPNLFFTEIKPVDNTFPYDDCKMKEEIDSMDGFLASTDDLIEQLHNESLPKKGVLKYDIFTSPQMLLNKDELGISNELCDDLAVVLSSPRWQILSWLLDKNELLITCEQYLRDSESAKNLTKELKYLNIDYEQFKHLPSSNLDEFGGIEKGYEHFVEVSDNESEICDSQAKSGYSSGSEIEVLKNQHNIPQLGKEANFKFNSPSDSRSRHGTTTTTTSLSESEDTDLEYTGNKGVTELKSFEGKRVTAVSNNERRKRLRIDANTGRVRASKSMVNDLRLYRHIFKQSKQKNFAPSLGTVNLSPSVVISESSKIKVEIVESDNNMDEENKDNSFSDGDLLTDNYAKICFKTETPITCPSRSSPESNRTSILRNERLNTPSYASSSSSETKPTFMLSGAPFKKYTWSNLNFQGNKSQKTDSSNSPVQKSSTPSLDIKSTKFQESYAKFILSNRIQISESDDKKNSKNVKLDINENTKEMLTNKSELYTAAQKNLLNRIMQLDPKPIAAPVNAIAMPVSHIPPNLPPDKGPPTVLSRNLPKGTTVVRRPRSEGAGPSGLNNGGTTVNIISRNPLSRPTVSITPNFSSQGNSSTSISRGIVVRSQINSNIDSNINFQNEINSLPPLPSATVSVAITPTSQSCNIITASPGEIQGGFGNRSSDIASSNNYLATPTTPSTVASTLGEPRTTSMLESLLRDQSGSHSFSSSNRSSPSGCATSFCESILASSVCTSITSNLMTDVYSPISGTSHSTTGTSILNSSDSRSTIIEESLERASEGNFSLDSPTSSFGTASVLTTVSSRILPSVDTASGAGNSSIPLGTSTTVTPSTQGCLSQYLLPAQLIQVQVSDGSTSLGLVPTTPLDFRLPPGTRVIKPNNTVSSTSVVPISHNSVRHSNVLHNVKIVQNRPVVRTVVVPHSVAMQSLGSHQAAQIVALNQSSIPATDNDSPQQHTTKIQSTQLQKLLGHNIVPGSLVIRAVRPSSIQSDVDIALSGNPSETIIKTENQEKVKPQSTDILADRIGRQSIKANLIASSTTQNVGTQTQTTAVKSATGQIVSQGLMTQIRTSTHSPTISNMPVVSHVESSPQPSSSGLNPLNIASNAVSSEALKQLREFESVFEKVSNKSVKESETDCCPETFPTTISTEESMIAAQLLNMANEPSVNVSRSFSAANDDVTDASVAVTASSPSINIPVTTSLATPPANLGENAFITSQAGTLILVNPAVSGSGIVTLSGTVQATQPPPAASPALSSSSQSSVASSTSNKSKMHSSNSKIVTPVSTPKPKSPPPPKVPPKPAVAKPQVEESDEIKAKIQSILDQYKQDLANNPQPQPAPRNRKNCPPPKNEGKSSSKKKSQLKKPDGTSSSPGSIESHLPSVSSSPANLSASTAGEDSDSSAGGPSVTPSRFSQDDKPKAEEPSSQVLQGVVLSNVKVDASTGLANFPSTIAGGRVFQLIRHGNGKVTAITTQQPYNKAKISLNQGGPPPNVTIQGRINVGDLMESHLASLITGGAGAVATGNTLITKLVQSPSNSGIQQLILQDSGQQSEHQVAVQPVLQARIKQPLLSEVIQGGTLVAEQTSASHKLVRHPIQSPSPNLSMGMSPEPESQLNPISSPQSRDSSPSRFTALDDESSNDSDESHESTPSGPLPPFFTLTKQFMTPAESRFCDKNGSSSSSKKKSSPSSKSEGDIDNLNSGIDSPNKPMSRAVYGSSSGIKNCVTGSGNKSMKSTSPTTANLENSSAILLKQSVQTYDLRSNNSLDSIKSSLSVEEEHIPPSPATLTKQLQNAYMTEAALSPAICQSQLSNNSSYPSPASIAEMQFSESNKDAHLSSNLCTSRRFAVNGSNRSSNVVNSCSNNLIGSNGLEASPLACLSSPSGDVYLDEASVALSLDNLALGEGHSQSPSLSDIVPQVPLLSWSPRSADSMMGHSPSLNDALSTSIALGTHHSEDSLCDSSTSFPALFSIEGDGVSVSSSTSEELNMPACHNTSLSMSTSRSYQSHLLMGQNRRDFSHEQDHTVSSTRIDSNNEKISRLQSIDSCLISSDSKDDASTESSESDWKFKCKNKYNRKSISFLSQRTNEGASTSYGATKCDEKGYPSKENQDVIRNRRRSQRQMDVSQKKTNANDNVAYNGFEKEECRPNEIADESCNLKMPKFPNVSELSVIDGQIKVESKPEVGDSKSLKMEIKEDDLPQRVTRGAKRRSEGGASRDEKKGKFCRNKNDLSKQEDGVKTEYEAQTMRITRSRHMSGTSDSSSNYSMDRVSTPGPQDSPMSSSTNGGGNRRKKRGGSRDSSVSSRDGSPLTILQNAYQEYGSPGITLGTRRASSREQAKKTLCACCVDQHPAQTGSTHSSVNRRSIGKSRGSGHSS